MPIGTGERSPGDIVQDMLRDMSEIMRGEIRLARAEMLEKAQKGGKAGGLFGAAAVGGLLAAMALVTCCIAALAIVMPLWLAALIMGVLLALAACGAFLAGRKRFRSINPVPERTVATVKENLQWAKHRMT